MWCGVITLFPAMFAAIQNEGITGRAIKQQILTLPLWNPRDYTKDKHHTVDDRPYGGGPGMVMMVPPLREALHAAKAAAPQKPQVIYVSPAGKRFDQSVARKWAQNKTPIVFLAGRYEGIDQRIIERDVDEQYSIGDYVLSGGELAVMVMIDALTRWLPGALGHEDSAAHDSFSEENQGLLDCPHYTRPAALEDEIVPAVLLEGNHQAIAAWRRKQSLGQTWLYRPELLHKLVLNKNDQKLLNEFQLEYTQKAKAMNEEPT